MARQRLRLGLKPPSGPRINWGHPLARQLLMASCFQEGGGVPTDLVAPNASVSRNGTTTWEARGTGSSLSQSGASGNFLSWGSPSKIAFSQADQFTIHIVATVGGGGGTIRNAMRNDNGSGSRPVCIFSVTAANVLRFAAYNTADAAHEVTGSTSITAAASTTRHLTAVRRVSGSDETFEVYLDGILDGSAADTIGTSWTLNHVWTTRFSTGSQAWNGAYSAVFIWNRALSADEVQSLYVNPWQILDTRVTVKAELPGAETASFAVDAGMSASMQREASRAATSAVQLGMTALFSTDVEQSATFVASMGMSASLATDVPASGTIGVALGMSALLGGLPPVPPDPPSPPIACESTPTEPAYTPTLVSYVEPSELTGS